MFSYIIGIPFISTWIGYRKRKMFGAVVGFTFGVILVLLLGTIGKKFY